MCETSLSIEDKKCRNEKSEFFAFLTFNKNDNQKQFCFKLQDAFAEPGQDSRNIAGIDIVIIVEDVQDVAPVFTLAPPVTRLPSGLIPGDKVMRPQATLSFLVPAVRALVISTFNKLSNSLYRFFKFTLRMATKAFREKYAMA